MVAVGPCTEADLPALIAAVDQEFVFAKGRTRGLAERFPRLFAADNVEQVQVARRDGRVVAAAASQAFELVDGGTRWRCAKVGAVWTDAACRGQGLASAVMRAVVAAHRAQGTQALTLWTSIHGFYAGLGWRQDDVGVFAMVDGKAGAASIPPRPVARCDRDALERMRHASGERFVARAGIDWNALPLPATEVNAFVGPSAYALVGTAGATGYVYELIGDEAGFAPVWQSILASHARVGVNGGPGRAAEWLQRQGVRFTAQQLAMWMPLMDEANALAGRLFVPYLDRI